MSTIHIVRIEIDDRGQINAYHPGGGFYTIGVVPSGSNVADAQATLARCALPDPEVTP